MSIPTSVRELLNRPPADVGIAVVGASNDRKKYGHIIMRDLEGKGYPVVPVNPSGGQVLGHDSVATPAEIAGPIEILDFVVPPPVALVVLDSVPKDRFTVLWFQPGSFDAAVVARARGLAPHVVAGPCIMVET